MKEQLVDEDLARRFLLGQVSPEEQGELEELAFEDPDTFSLLESVEDDLIDEFIQDELSAAEKERFKTHFLSQPGRRENLKLSRALQHHFNEEDVPAVIHDDRVSVLSLFKVSHAVFRLSLAAAILIVLVIAIWLYVKVREAQRPPAFEARKEEVATPTPSITNGPSVEPSPSATHDNKNSAPSPPREVAPSVYAVLLPLGSIRGEAQPLLLPSKGANIQVALPLTSETTYSSYEATLQSEDGTVLKRWPGLSARLLRPGQSLLIQIPITMLTPQDFYLITVRGRSADGTLHEVHKYPFQATNTPKPPNGSRGST